MIIDKEDKVHKALTRPQSSFESVLSRLLVLQFSHKRRLGTSQHKATASSLYPKLNNDFD